MYIIVQDNILVFSKLIYWLRYLILEITYISLKDLD